MARPLSEEKERAILIAATEIVAEMGLTASTALIAKSAGVADGTLFTYFPTKDGLFNSLYIAIKEEIAAAMLRDYPQAAAPEDRARHVWGNYVRWGVRNPEKRKVIAQLAVSHRLTPATQKASMQPLVEIERLLGECVEGGSVSRTFAAAIMTALVETTMTFMTAEPEQAASYAETGFRAFWRAIEER